MFNNTLRERRSTDDLLHDFNQMYIPDSLQKGNRSMTAIAGEVLYAFPKNAYEEVRAYLQEYKGQMLAHIRVFITDKNDIDHPTRKGIAVTLNDLPKLAEAVAALQAAVDGAEK
jgi:hypothetical protein